MKTKSHIFRLPAAFSALGGLMLALLVFNHSAWAGSAADLLEKGIYTEETKGELKAALQIYEQIIADQTAERSVVAQAQLRLGLCELKLGNKSQAISALNRLTQDFPDKEKLLAIVGQNMPQLLDEIVRQIGQNYLQEVDRGELLDTALRAIVGKLDAQSSLLRPDDLAFLGAKEVARLNESIDQRIGGIGAVLKFDDTTREVLVTSPLPNSPALRAGLLAGDSIVTVNGSSLPAEKTLESTVKLLRGPVGSEVTVGIRRRTGETVELRLVRDTVQIASVKGDRYKSDHTWDFMLDESRKTGYLRLTQLGRQSATEMQNALNELLARGMQSLVLDLRNNPGGILDGAIAVADLFVESGRIVTVRGRADEKHYDARAEGTYLGFPIVVLVNHNTASAAEIIAACLQDHHRAAVVGERTYGQALVRTLVELKSGAGALKIPVAAYYRPDGRNMNRYPNSKTTDDWGVSPDPGGEVIFTEMEQMQYEKNRTERDILDLSPAGPVRLEDRQLQKALELLEGKLRG